MLKISDSTAVYAAFLSSDRLVRDAKGRTRDRSGANNSLMQAVMDYEPYIQRKLRHDDVYAMLETHGLSGFSDDSLDECFSEVLSTIVGEYLQWQGNCFEVKPEMLSSWLELLSVLDSSWIIAQAYKELAENYQFNVHEISHCIEEYQCPFALPLNSTQAKFADNHVHLGGHGMLTPSLLSFCLYGESIDDKFHWPKRVEYSLVESGVFTKFELVGACKLNAECVGYSIFSESKLDNQKFNFEVLSATKRDTIDNPAQLLLIRSAKTELSSMKRWLLYTTAILLGSVDKMAVLNLIRLCNILRNYMVVSGVGLSEFVTTSRFRMRDTRAVQQQNSIIDGLEFDIEDNTAREFRVTPNAILAGKGDSLDPKQFAEGLKHLYLNSISENSHFVLHFTRSGKRSDKLQQKKRNTLIKQVEYLQDFSQSITFSEHDIVQSSSLKSKLVAGLDLRKAVRGYDVAGNENELPIEVFAPALRVLRESRYPTKGIKFNRIFKPFLTVHAGEDYSHLISGMRAIDESVVFCNFGSGDRIGHGLALGILPISWAKKQETAYISVGEHLDNLVWSYQKALLVVQSVPDMVGILQLLADKISFWCEYLYQESHSPKRLYDAWRLRRNCPVKVASYYATYGKDSVVPQHDSAFRGWIVDFRDDYDTYKKAKHVDLWKKYLYAQRDELFFKRREKIVTITCSSSNRGGAFGIEKNLAFDSISSVELDLYEAIQDLCIESYADKGVILEACPTSNIYIGRFKHYHEHPIYRWHPPEEAWLEKGGKFNKYGLRNGSVPVCINTDDSALMPTTIRNEYRVVKEAAICHFGVGVNKAEDWIDRIRQKGVEVFEENHLNWVN
ncbi:antiviral RADAR system adenosine deaminase RdrB [Vibrio brasiliensis]|nr:antiviral RADAR system adenosine deaminase RdrB [Vibrio brasiliensis]